jgi:hypothetical protein
LYFQSDLKIKNMWWINGCNYSKTCEVSGHQLDTMLKGQLVTANLCHRPG